MEINAAVANEFAEVNSEFITTRHGTIDKTELINLCIDDLHTTNVFNVDPHTLFQLFDAVNQEESQDEVVDAYTNRILYPVRIQVVKSLFYFLYDEEMKGFLEYEHHKALDLAMEAKRQNMVHKTHEVNFSESVTCTCDKAVSSKNLLACDCCKTVLCQDCSQAPCPVLIKDMMMKTDEINDEMVRNCGYRPSFNDADDEDYRAEDIGKFLANVFNSVDDEESSEEDDDDMEVDYEDVDSDEEIIVCD